MRGIKGIVAFLITVFLSGNAVVLAANSDTGFCGKKGSTTEWLKQFHLQSNDYDVRAKYAVCLIRHDFSKKEVSSAIFKVVKNEKEDLIFREDLILALSQANFRVKTTEDSELIKPLSTNEKQAVDRTIASAGVLLDVAGSVKKIDQFHPSTNIENEFLQYLSSIVKDTNRDVQIRIVSMQTLVNVLAQIMKSGVYDTAVVKSAVDSIKHTANLSDNASHYTRAKDALKFLGVSDQAGSSRTIASVSRK